jgi:hypothetical protein
MTMPSHGSRVHPRLYGRGDLQCSTPVGLLLQVFSFSLQPPSQRRTARETSRVYMRDTSRNYRKYCRVAVSIRHTGPYPFLRDTGAPTTSLNAALAAQPQLAQPQRKSGVAFGVIRRDIHGNRNSKEKLP